MGNLVCFGANWPHLPRRLSVWLSPGQSVKSWLFGETCQECLVPSPEVARLVMLPEPGCCREENAWMWSKQKQAGSRTRERGLTGLFELLEPAALNYPIHHITFSVCVGGWGRVLTGFKLDFCNSLWKIFWHKNTRRAMRCDWLWEWMEGAKSQGMQAASRSWRRHALSLKVPGRNAALQTHTGLLPTEL